jgi:anti-sigma regulatory factor (Ser/Thr protein kinase)
MAQDGLRKPVPPRPAGARREVLSAPGEAASVPLARRFVRRTLEQWDRSEYEEAGTLLVSELVTNAVLHARTDLSVELVDGEDGVLLAVADESPGMPVLRRHSREAGTGRGLWLLDQYAASHGSTSRVRARASWCGRCSARRSPTRGRARRGARHVAGRGGGPVGRSV